MSGNSSIDRILADELRVYEVHINTKQAKIIEQFEQTALSSRAGVLEEELARYEQEIASAASSDAAPAPPDAMRREQRMKEFEANLEAEIDAQRQQLHQSLAMNRSAKLAQYKQELITKMMAFMHQHEEAAQQPEQPQQAFPHSNNVSSQLHSFTASPASISMASIPTAAAGVSFTTAQETYAPSSADVAHVAQVRQQVAARDQDQQRFKHLEEEHHHKFLEEERLQKESYERSAKLAEQQRLHRLEQQANETAAAETVHRYEYRPTVTRIENSPIASPVASPLQSSQPPPAIVSAEAEDELRRRWIEIQQELHGKNAPSVAVSSIEATHSTISASPSGGSHLQHVTLSPAALAGQKTAETLSKVESALEMDWNEAWNDLSKNPPASRTFEPKHTYVPSSIQSSPAPSAYAFPQRTPMTEKLSKAVVVAPSQVNMSPAEIVAQLQPAQLMQQASGLFKSTLHELEEKAEYLQNLIAAFREAEREMEDKLTHEREHDGYQQASHRNREHYDQDQDYDQKYDEQQEQAYQSRSSNPPTGSAYRRSASADRFQPTRSTTRFQTAAAAPSRPRTTASSSTGRSASVTRSTPGAITYPANKRAPAVRPASASVKKLTPTLRPAPARATSSYTRPALSAPPAALNYPRPRTASAKAALQRPPPSIKPTTVSAKDGVRLARNRIRAIIDKTRVKPIGVSVLSHPRPTHAFVAAGEAKGGLRPASVQEVLLGAGEIAARKSMPPTLRPTQDRKPEKKDLAVDYEFTPSSPSHPHGPLSLIQVAKEQQAYARRLTTHAGVPPVSAFQNQGRGPAIASSPSHSELHTSYDDINASHDDLNTTEGLIAQEERAQSRHDGQLESYLRALALPASSDERRVALAKLAAKAQLEPPVIYASPLRTHPSQRQPKETFTHRADAIVRGSHASLSTHVPASRDANATLQEIIYMHDHLPAPQLKY